eukprot:TRINITY_DN9691_c0_g1_i10.p3 TRINITY_DN9691_c0_g1~~TRINITY_DN9691_c0_g1_i10.p3  ORF type:complete len:105 (-),score=3.38 TRINITY_DN9691_c0_g1_i10:1331-1645(-)
MDYSPFLFVLVLLSFARAKNDSAVYYNGTLSYDNVTIELSDTIANAFYVSAEMRLVREGDAGGEAVCVYERVGERVLEPHTDNQCKRLELPPCGQREYLLDYNQ